MAATHAADLQHYDRSSPVAPRPQREPGRGGFGGKRKRKTLTNYKLRDSRTPRWRPRRASRYRSCRTR